ncbi:lanthionine synthetase C family protein [Sungkyunkwania multivorans]|uniref:Lanthionine synthetase C family protein n=1 Tax=Sungkyunkwania multivorans TaxID=1173618 RepID=A0ABW3CZA2_9FLAO
METDARIHQKLTEINKIIESHWQESKDIGVLSGISGIALFQFYYSRLVKEESVADLGAEMISATVERINDGFHLPTFCSGIAGAAWTIELLKEEEFVELDTDELLGDLDDFLETFLKLDNNKNFYDFLHGVMGVGFYFLKRYQRTASAVFKKKYEKLLMSVIDRLKETAIKENDTLRWESNLRREEHLIGYNLSLSHGHSSIINFLSRLARIGVFKDEVTALLKMTVKYVEEQAYMGSENSSLYPDWITTNGHISGSGRLAWCYGDLGIGVSFWHAGNALKNDRLSKKGLDILKHTSKRRDLEEVKIVDAGLCHGAFGVMHIYQAMYRATGDAAFKEAADFWMKQALDMAIHEDGYAGYCQWSAGEQPGWRKELNLLEGIAGIGLAMISYIAPFDTKWDECLLIG